MFNYFGSKSKIAKYYPPPKYDTIIEPFAGAAHYSLLHHTKKVILNEKYDIIYKIWDYLINKAEPKNILKKTKFYYKQDLRKIKFDSEEIRNIIGFLANHGSTAPANIVQEWTFGAKNIKHSSSIEYNITKIAKTLHKIKHWKIIFGDYKDLPNIEATWFIDPPYQSTGSKYIISDIDYQKLSNWCKERKGQIIVCENNEAKWLDFIPHLKIQGMRKKSIECIWTNYKQKNIYDFLKNNK